MYSNPYDKITGLWTKKYYILLKKLGAGGIGEIYLVQDALGCLLALKVSKDVVSITKEYRFLSKLQGKYFVPKVYDLDDLERQGETYHFFTMEYIKGYNLKQVLADKSMTVKTKLQLMGVVTDIIRQINEAGYIYTDLKHENIMVDGEQRLVRLIDFGSLAEEGNTVKEFTPMYDPLSWGRGNRIAGREYQVFVIGMLLISLMLSRSLDPEQERLEGIIPQLRKRRIPRNVIQLALQCIEGQMRDCSVLYRELCCASEGLHYGERLKRILNVVIGALSFAIAMTVFSFIAK
jgi:serine/threonine-protein kinase